ncbi:MAG: hypothetical protein FD118_1918 [Rhodocyclaceae bacterium]|nr:MAG: hypothetical protein FD118_1918 [Rhodocyclaceae bacterium]
MFGNSLRGGKTILGAQRESPDSRLRPSNDCTSSQEVRGGAAPDSRRSFGLDEVNFGAGGVSSVNSFPWQELRWTAYPPPRFACVIGAARASVDMDRNSARNLQGTKQTILSAGYDHHLLTVFLAKFKKPPPRLYRGDGSTSIDDSTRADAMRRLLQQSVQCRHLSHH